MKSKTILLFLLGLAVYLLHQDCWNWRKIEPMVFGFLPVGFAYHIGFSILCTVFMAILVKFAWPSHLESVDSHRDEAGRNAKS